MQLLDTLGPLGELLKLIVCFLLFPLPMLPLLLLLCLPLSPIAAGGVRSIYNSSVNPSAFSLLNATTEPTIDFAWSPATRPYPGPFGALWMALFSPPPEAPPGTKFWLRATYGAQGSGAMLKLWLDDHFLINAQSSNSESSSVGYYPLPLSPTGSLLRVEYAAIGENATAQVAYSLSAAGPWTPLPADLLSPAIPAPEDAYQARRSAEEVGWGTFDAKDMLSSVLLPSGLAFPLSFYDAGAKQATAHIQMECSSSLRVGLHAARGDYTEIESLALNGGAATVRVETATTAGGELIVLISTLTAPRGNDVTVIIDASNALPYSACESSAAAGGLSMACAGTPAVKLQPAGGAAAAAAATDTPGAAPSAQLTFSLPAAGASLALTTAPGGLSLAAAQRAVANRRAELVAAFDTHGQMNETFAGLFTAVAWTTIYSHTQGLVNGEFGRSEMLYEWDTLLASTLAVHVDQWAAYNNLIRICKGAVPQGFFPGFINNEFGEVDNAKPPVGALVLRAVFDAFGEPWLVHLTLDKLVRYSAWWAEARMVDGIIAPGSVLDPELAPIEHAGHSSLQAAKWETGLDNSPLYDTATFNATSGLMSQWDVGLQALYIADALMLAGLAAEVNRSDLVADLRARASAATARLQNELWCEEAGTYFNKDYVTGAWVPWAAPTTFYPLLAGAPSAPQVEMMLERYYFNSSELCGDASLCIVGIPSISRANPAFKAQNYWRGRIWGPMNYLVWRGLRAYPQSPGAVRAAQQLALQSRAVFLEEWLKNRHVMENYSGVDGSGCRSANNANPFYHWGALTAIVAVEQEAFTSLQNESK